MRLYCTFLKTLLITFFFAFRGELYGVLDFISNIGGLLGLCAGFSALSFVEVVYFFTVRLFFNVKIPRIET